MIGNFWSNRENLSPDTFRLYLGEKPYWILWVQDQITVSVQCYLNPLPQDNVLDLFKFKAFADDKVNIT